MKRFEIIDGMRGYFLVFMLINHLIFVGGYWMMEVNHRQFAFVEDAQGFVFLSGLLIGMVYARKMIKNGYEKGRQLLFDRAFELYRYAMGTVMAVLVVQLILPDAQRLWYNWLGTTNFDEPLRLAAIATFLFQPTFMDILPQYIVYMLFAPPLVWLCLRGKWAHVLAGSLIVWMAAQLGLQRFLTEPLNALVMGPDEQGIRASFNMLGWQIVFFSAMVIGVLTAQNKIAWTRIFSPEKTMLPKVALAVCLFFLPLRIVTAWDLLPQAVLDKFATMEIRADFGPVYLLNFAAVATGLAWLLIAGPKHHNLWIRKLAGIVTAVFTFRFLRLLGRHSLQVYVWHVAIVYAVYYADGRTPELSQLTKTTIAVVCIGLLALPALWRERDQIVASLFGQPKAEPARSKPRSAAR
ncbi:OpgC family protein [Shinella sumterensis]|uniref:OpgC domain-containing protein n=1 Tax=Shinella sumterensis TaxID=1967501 RepID=A0AA50CM53_9HYPH|nr:OpgC domain-containing protein [Shinella sumterensis]WLR97806.1 OpgC domain-containing protein [Shinella sumterensis]